MGVGMGRGVGADMMIYSMFKRFSTNVERHQGKAEGASGGGVGVRHDDLLNVQAIFNKRGTSSGQG